MAYPQTTFQTATIHKDSLIGRRREAVSTETLLYQLRVLRETGRYDAFRLKWHPVYDEPPLVWPVPNHLFWDSDVAKWIEGACYFLKQESLPLVDAAVRELVDMIRGAQQPDGYLNIHYTVVEPGKRFTNLKDMHELYNAGHLIEAALAHHDLYQNELLLEPIVKYVDLLHETFGIGPQQLHGYPGHPEIELSLLRLYERTANAKHLDLAVYFISERGNSRGVEGQNYFVWEAKQRNEDPDKRPAFYPEPMSLWYHQAHEPIAMQQTIEGHSVRAMYLLTAVSDLIRIQPHQHPDLKAALYRLWSNMIQRKMYVTGGIGAIKQWEGFGPEFFLPQGTDEGGCYAETCASIGVMMLAQRLLQLEQDAKIADIMELCLYNGVLTAMSPDGKAFTYVNQLASSDSDLAKRCDWFTVACCPPNMLRLLGSIGGYVWDRSTDKETSVTTVTAYLFVSSTFSFHVGEQEIRVTQQSQWPWEDRIEFKVDAAAGVDIDLRLRIPAWAQEYSVEPQCPHAVLSKGFLQLPAKWISRHPQFSLTIPLRHRWISGPLQGDQDTVALARGPVIYCVEDYDNTWVKDHFKTTYVDTSARVVEKMETETGEQYCHLILRDGSRSLGDTMSDSPFEDLAQVAGRLRGASVIPDLNFVPFCLRSNRGGKGQSRVQLKRFPA